MEYIGCPGCGAVLFRAPGSKCPQCGAGGGGGFRLPWRGSSARWKPAVGGLAILIGAAMGVYHSGFVSGTPLGGTSQPAGTLRGPEGRWEMTLGRPDWWRVEPAQSGGATRDLSLEQPGHAAMFEVGWVSIPPGTQVGVDEWQRHLEEGMRQKYPDFSARPATLVMSGSRHRALEVTCTEPRLGKTRGYYAMVVAGSRMYMLVGGAREADFATYRPELERMVESFRSNE